MPITTRLIRLKRGDRRGCVASCLVGLCQDMVGSIGLLRLFQLPCATNPMRHAPQQGKLELPSKSELPPLDHGVRPPKALYLHFPFCEHRCHYCDFSVKRAAQPPVSAWLEAIETEADWWFAVMDWEPPIVLDTLFIGGGTPSLLGSLGLVELRGLLGRWFEIDAETTEWTVEANPASFTGKRASVWRDMGVNRVSLGVQSFDDEVLTWLGRLHDRERAIAAVLEAHAAGFERISIDLIFGLPSEVERDLSKEIEEALTLDLSHISLYGLSIEARTPLAEWIRSGRVGAPSDARYADGYRLLARTLRSAGYDHYEVSNFARPGEQCRHNWYYWNRAPYLAFGPSAHGFIPPVRTWNVYRWDQYERSLRGGMGPIAGWERVSKEDEALERIWMDLRTIKGLPVRSQTAAESDQFERWANVGWLERQGDRWVPTVEGWLRMDSMVAEIASTEV